MTASVQELYLVRHAESLANAGLDDGFDTPLSPTGRMQAGQCAEFLADRLDPRCTLLLASPFRRTVQTADLIARRCELRIRLEPALHELFLAEWLPDGKAIGLLSLPELAATFPRIAGPCPDGIWWPERPETLADVSRRAAGMRNRLLGREFSSQVVVCVSHYGFLQALARALDDNLILMNIPNASVTHLRRHGNRFTANAANNQITLAPGQHHRLKTIVGISRLDQA